MPVSNFWLYAKMKCLDMQLRLFDCLIEFRKMLVANWAKHAKRKKVSFRNMSLYELDVLNGAWLLAQ